LSTVEQRRICAARRRSGWGPRLIAGETGHPHATVWRTLKRAGISRPPREQREAPRLYEWPCPGDLLHIDSKRFVRFSRPGHAVTGDRHRTGREKRMRIGYEWVHSIVDDHSRYAYSELHPDERADTVTAFVERALAHLAELEIEPKRLLSDNAFVYRHNRSLRELLQAQGIEHRFIRPRRPQTNGKVSATNKRSNANGDSAASTAPATTAAEPCHTGCATTTSAGHTAHSAANHQSAASTTSRGRTPRAADVAARHG
jgi:transposase InsO family protein